MSDIEILAPAGSKDAFLAALGAGADAVYAGLGTLNARRGASNFTLKSLKQCTKRAHLLGSKVYATVNVAILPAEMEEALALVADAWNAGVDAIIAADIGLIAQIVARMPEVRIHASTQINAHDAATVRALADLGVSRVTLARELSLAEISTLVAVGHEAGIEVEVFAHGALCVSYSGQCLFSSLVGRRSANRGSCAQPCRLPYELIDRKGEALAEGCAHILSPRDLCTIELLDELVATGVDSLKIEGRMKSPGYVATVVADYRAALDRAPALSAPSIPPLDAVYNRGYTAAYLGGERGNEMMSYRKGAGKERSAQLAEFAEACIARAASLDIADIEVHKRIEFEPEPLRKRKVRFGQQSIEVVAVVATVGAARAALNADANEAHLDARELVDEEAIAGMIPILPRVCHDDEFEELLGVAYRFGGAVCSTLGQLRVCAERGIPAQTHWSLNVTNAQTCDELARMGAERVWLSPELSESQINAIARRTAIPLGMGIAGMTEMMVTEHCVLMAQGSCAQDCEDCPRRRGPTALRDRKGYSFPVRTDRSGRSHLYNAVPLDLTGALPEILASGASAVRVDLETALTDFVPVEVARIRHALIDVYAGRDIPSPRENTTRGHFFRGVT
jgi:collagenase-like PrtC family protease